MQRGSKPYTGSTASGVQAGRPTCQGEGGTGGQTEAEARRAKRRETCVSNGGEPKETALKMTTGGCEIRNNYDLERIIPTCFSMRGSSDSLKLLLQWFEERQLP